MANKILSKARKDKQDEWYTVYDYIQTEVNAYLDYNPNVFKNKTILLPCDDPEWSNFTRFFAQNFERFQLKKLISTSFAIESKINKYLYQPTLFETQQPYYDKNKTRIKGKIFTLDHDTNKNGKIDIDDLEWKYLKGDGDFRSDEIKKLRDKADIIITNPPFSLFDEFLTWIMEANKKFLIISSMNAISYKGIFPLIRDNKIWAGATCKGQDMVFKVPNGIFVKESDNKKAERLGYKGKEYTRAGNTLWFTNIEHGKRHEPMKLMTMKDNLKYNKKLINKFEQKYNNIKYYPKYDNYDAIEVPLTKAIPKDYDGIMGVPLTFIYEYCPEQFEILDINPHFFSLVEKGLPKIPQLTLKKICAEDPYVRILIRRKK